MVGNVQHGLLHQVCYLGEMLLSSDDSMMDAVWYNNQNPNPKIRTNGSSRSPHPTAGSGHLTHHSTFSLIPDDPHQLISQKSSN
jgi:hypothetical protein